MNIKVKIKVNMDGVPTKIHRIATNKQLGKAAAMYMKTLMEPYVPYDTGHLNGSAKPEAFSVTYTAPYARYPYEGNRVHAYTTEHHPQAQSHWDEAMDRGKLAQFIQNYIKGM